MRELKRKANGLRMDIIKNRIFAAGNFVMGSICVPLEVLAHLSPFYWIYKVATYHPKNKEMETLYFFEDGKEQLATAREDKVQLKEVKKEIQTKREKEIQNIIDGNQLSEEVLEYAGNIMTKLKGLSVREQKAFILKVKKVLDRYAHQVKELETCPNEIYELNQKTIKRLVIIETTLNTRLSRQIKLSQNLETEETKVLSLIGSKKMVSTK